MTELKDRLALALEKRGRTPADLARGIDKSRAAVSQWLDGKVKGMRGDSLLPASAWLQVNPKWLSSGVGPSGLESPGESLTQPIALQAGPIDARSINAINLGMLLEAVHPSLRLAAYAAASQALIGFLGRSAEPKGV